MNPSFPITKSASFLLGFALFILAVFGCTPSGGREKAEDIVWDTVSYYQLTPIRVADSGKSVLQDFSIIVPHNNFLLQQEINRVILGVGESDKSTRQVIDSIAETSRRQFVVDSAWQRELPYSEKVHSSLHYYDGQLASFAVESEYLYGTGKHYSNRCYYSFELPDGKALSESAIFVDGYEQELIALLVNRLKEEGEGRVYNLDEIAPNGNFLIDDKGITYCFQDHLVAHDADDTVEIFLPWNELQGILLKVTPVEHLY